MIASDILLAFISVFQKYIENYKSIGCLSFTLLHVVDTFKVCA